MIDELLLRMSDGLHILISVNGQERNRVALERAREVRVEALPARPCEREGR